MAGRLSSSARESWASKKSRERLRASGRFDPVIIQADLPHRHHSGVGAQGLHPVQLRQGDPLQIFRVDARRGIEVVITLGQRHTGAGGAQVAPGQTTSATPRPAARTQRVPVGVKGLVVTVGVGIKDHGRFLVSNGVFRAAGRRRFFFRSIILHPGQSCKCISRGPVDNGGGLWYHSPQITGMRFSRGRKARTAVRLMTSARFAGGIGFFLPSGRMEPKC